MSYYEDSVSTKVRRFFRETFGFRGSKNLMSWVVAGGVAYYYFYLPELKRRQEIQVAREAAKKWAIEKGLHDIDRAKPIPDPQDTGLVKGVKAAAKAQQLQQERQHQQQQQQQQLEQQRRQQHQEVQQETAE